MLIGGLLYHKVGNMTKENNLIVAGANWIAEVELDDISSLSEKEITMEAATRAVEAYFKRRNDIEIIKHEPIEISLDDRNNDELHGALVDLLQDELISGCGIGMLLCIVDPNIPEESGVDNEWYVSSKSILENVGVPDLVKRFDEKYP